jgi:ABC-type branched-subunit amino acid transport system ATPase component
MSRPHDGIEEDAAVLFLEGGTSEAVPAASASRLALAALEGMPFVLLLVPADRLSVAFGVDGSTIAAIRVLCFASPVVGAGLAVVSLHRRPRRARTAAAAAVLGGGVLAFGSVAPNLPLAAAGFVVASMAAGAARAARHASTADAGRPPARPAAFVDDRIAFWAGIALCALAALHLPGGWRGASLVFGALTVGGGLPALRVGEVPLGAADAGVLRRFVNQRERADVATDERLDLSPAEAIREVLAERAVRLWMFSIMGVGGAVASVVTFSAVALREHHHVAADGRATLLGAAAAAAAVLATLARRTVMARRAPATDAMWSLAGVVALIIVAFAPSPWVLTVFLAVVLASLALVEGMVLAATTAVVTPSLRLHAAGLAAATFAFGAAQGLLLSKSLEGHYGVTTALVVLALTSLLPAAHAVSALTAETARRAPAVVRRLVQDQETRVRRGAGAEVPLLVCSHVDFSYGTLQVLFDVSFTVRAGERVALLGTNGAGKSTLLRVISGLGRPSAGVVRFDGEDITSLDPDRRVGGGIVQVTGGKARFPTLTVADNLRVYGHSIGRQRRLLDARMDAVYDVFPALAERRNSPASVLSGGEAQMLALAKALLLEPRLLLIDELSLGLAPIVVGELLTMVERINARGTAIVIVEQSVNIALSVVDHAYFMEKGRIRFDGPASDLLGRDDLLRSVFLEGAGRDR